MQLVGRRLLQPREECSLKQLLLVAADLFVAATAVAVAAATVAVAAATVATAASKVRLQVRHKLSWPHLQIRRLAKLVVQGRAGVRLQCVRRFLGESP